jgi:hypothetical protein
MKAYCGIRRYIVDRVRHYWPTLRLRLYAQVRFEFSNPFRRLKGGAPPEAFGPLSRDTVTCKGAVARCRTFWCGYWLRPGKSGKDSLQASTSPEGPVLSSLSVDGSYSHPLEVNPNISVGFRNVCYLCHCWQ